MSKKTKSHVFIVEVNIELRQTTLIDLDNFTPDWNDASKIYWIHYTSNDSGIDKQAEKLTELLHLEKGFLHDVVSKRWGTQIQTQENSLMIPLEYWSIDAESNNSKIDDYAIYLTHRYCLTVSKGSVRTIQDLFSKYKASIEFVRTPGFILFLVVEESVNDYSETLLEFDLMSDSLDAKIQRKFDSELYEDIVHVKREMLRFKHNIYKLRDTITRLVSRKHSVVSESCRTSLGDLLGHCSTLVQEVDAEVDFINGSLDSLTNLLSQEMNETMRLLTVFAAILLPVALVPAVYGMNFGHIPELGWKYGYFYALGLMFTVGTTVFLVLKKKKWI